MLELALEIENVPNYSMVGLIYGLIGLMIVVIVVGWISSIITRARPASQKQISADGKQKPLNHKRGSNSKK